MGMEETSMPPAFERDEASRFAMGRLLLLFASKSRAWVLLFYIHRVSGMWFGRTPTKG